MVKLPTLYSIDLRYVPGTGKEVEDQLYQISSEISIGDELKFILDFVFKSSLNLTSQLRSGKLVLVYYIPCKGFMNSMQIKLRYGQETIKLDIPEKDSVGIFSSGEIKQVNNIHQEIKPALDNPIASNRLEDMIKPTNTVAIVIEDLTRSVPTNVLLPHLIKRIRKKRIPYKNIKIVIALGLHRKLSAKEKRSLVGKLSERIEIINHDPNDRSKLVKLGSNFQDDHHIFINKTVADADIKILTGDIIPHQLFGYGGGAKNVLPGIADAETIRRNHSMFIELGETLAGELDNPLRNEAEEAAQLLGVDFILNVVLNHKKEIVGAFTGDVREAFLEGVKFADELYKVQVPKRVENVVVSCGGYPKDIDLYQAQKAVESAKKIVKKNGKIFLIAECREGWGSTTFREWIEEAADMKDVVKRIKRGFVIGGHKAYLFAKEKEWADLYLHSELKSEQLNKFITPVSLDEIEEILKIKSGTVGILPAGTSTITVVTGEC